MQLIRAHACWFVLSPKVEITPAGSQNDSWGRRDGEVGREGFELNGHLWKSLFNKDL